MNYSFKVEMIALNSAESLRNMMQLRGCEWLSLIAQPVTHVVPRVTAQLRQGLIVV
jgi:hypothetical protein